MRMDIFLQKSSNLFAENRLLKLAVFFLCIALAINSFFVYRAVKYQRVILIPPKMTGTVEFVQGKPSDQYVKDLARRMVNLALTYSPANARAQFSELLAMFAPDVYPQASRTWYSLASRIEETLVSSVFYLEKISLDNANNRLEITGMKKQFAEDRAVDESNKTYVIKYRIDAGQFFILSLMEKGQEEVFEK